MLGSRQEEAKTWKTRNMIPVASMIESKRVECSENIITAPVSLTNCPSSVTNSEAWTSRENII
jgi:hypothetical protein